MTVYRYEMLSDISENIKSLIGATMECLVLTEISLVLISRECPGRYSVPFKDSMKIDEADIYWTRLSNVRLMV